MVLQGRKVLRCPHNDFADFQRVIDLNLELGGRTTIVFPEDFTDDWLQFGGSHRTLSVAQDEFADALLADMPERPAEQERIVAANRTGFVGAVA